jgi:hypothetical protein
MTEPSLLTYNPPDIINAFIKTYAPGELFSTWIVGPYGSAKTTGMFFKLAYMASLQEPSPDGIRYSRAVVVRNTASQLTDTTLVSWDYWFKDGQAGEWRASDKEFTLRFGDVCCEVIFRPLDTPADIVRALGLEVTFALIDEFREIPRQIIEGLSGRCGRWKPPGGVPVTNYGMWGASNPGNEDLWWFDYLHGAINPETGLRQGCIEIRYPTSPEDQAKFELVQGYTPRTFDWYFKQPSGLSPEAENIENLPGGRKYYENMAKNKSKEWIKQYIEAEWGFSIGGTPVINSFIPDLHISKSELRYNPRLRLVIGVDPGLGGSAFIFMQQALDGRLYVLGELVQRGISTEQLIDTRLKPYLRERFPGARVIIAPDPAAAIRSQNDAKTGVKIFKTAFPGCVSVESNNRLPLRINAIDYYCNKLSLGKPSLQIDPIHCPVLIRALKGGWRWGIDTKKDEIKGLEPEKNPWSHPGDAFGYGCRYFHRGMELAESGRGKPLPPQDFRTSYHMT